MAKYLLHDLFEGNYRVSQKYGNNKLYYARFGFLLGHEGVDWATPVGTNALNPFDNAQVLRAGYDSKYGWHLVLWDFKQLCAVWYCHLSKINVKVGDKIKLETVVAKTGNTGNSSGPHLHVNFVETTATGARKNIFNGNKGFLNILDPNLVRWVLTR